MKRSVLAFFLLTGVIIIESISEPVCTIKCRNDDLTSEEKKIKKAVKIVKGVKKAKKIKNGIKKYKEYKKCNNKNKRERINRKVNSCNKNSCEGTKSIRQHRAASMDSCFNKC